MPDRRVLLVPVLRLVPVALALAGAAPALAADSGTLVVNATVLSKSNCKFQSTSTATASFGSIDPSVTSPVTATANLTIKCQGSATTASWAITGGDGLYPSGPGQRRMRHATTTTEFMPYSLNLPASGTVGKGVDYVVTFTATIAPAGFQDAIAGSYSDTVAITLAP
jgi:spore coat protein U-like protein